MPSIQDVADQINAKLDHINDNTAATVAALQGLDADLNSGVSELAQGLFAIWELQKVTNSILDFHTKQNNTVICLLENTNELLCGITRKLTRQLDMSAQLVTSLKRIEGITERVDAAAASDYDRLAALEQQIRACCPPEEPRPEPCPPACPVSEPTPYQPHGQDWSPRPRQQPVG